MAGKHEKLLFAFVIAKLHYKNFRGIGCIDNIVWCNKMAKKQY